VSPDPQPVQTLFSGGHARWWSDLYGSNVQTLEAHLFRQRRDTVLALMERHVPRERRVLDLGCGTGPLLAALRGAGWACAGLDGAPDMLDHARARLAAAGLTMDDLHLGDCRNTAFESGRFDAVLCLGVISYIEHYEPVLREIWRVLSPGGLAIVSCRNAASLDCADPWRMARRLAEGLLRRRRPEPFTPGRFLRRSVVRQRIRQAGLSVDSEIGIGFGPPRLAGRRLLPDAAEIRLSDALSRLVSHTRLWPIARPACDISLWVLRKPEVHAERP
jgi:SAM-dependent methyltransferase